jgi:uncharacterized protein (DUF2236 family)
MAPGEPASWKLHREVILLAGWGRAILLQLAHPLVAQGVADHSGFSRGAADAFARLRRTVDAMLAMTFGPPARAREAVRAINRTHDRVHGCLPGPAGRFPKGHRYSAHDPALLAWVHATLVDSQLLTYRLLVGRLPPSEGDRYCLEASAVEDALGIPQGRLPRSEAELRAYLAATLASGDIAVTDTARRLAAAVLTPPFPRPLAGVSAWAGRLVTAALLPAEIREAYGLPWSRARERGVRVGLRAARIALPLVPPPLRYWAHARGAERGARSSD